MKAALAAFAACLLLACTARTVIHPLPKEDAKPEKYVAPGGCNVRDFSAATDLPSGSKNLGWVSVEEQADGDEAAMLLLRQKICELGGNALSQAGWVKGPADDKPKLTANAWVLP